MSHRFYFLGFLFGFATSVTYVTCVPAVPLLVAIAGSTLCWLFSE